MTVWTTGNSLGTARSSAAGCGSSAAGFVAGGGAYLKTSEEMNALVWAAGGSMGTGRTDHSAFGTQSAAVMTTGKTGTSTWTSLTENYNGTSFAYGTSYSATIALAYGCGTSSAGLVCGGSINNSHTGIQNATNTSNGSAWSATGNLVSHRYVHAAAGSQSAAFECGGENNVGAMQSTSNKFNGSTWASSGALPASGEAAAAFGTQTAGRACGGINSSYAYVATTYLYNGSTWSTGNSLNTARRSLSGGSEVAAGGFNSGGASAVSEIYGDRIPSAFGFTDAVDANLSTVTTSDTVTPTGYDVTTSWTVTGGEASVAGGAWATSGTINPGQNIQLRATSSASYATAVSATLTIGGISDVWYVTTRNAPVPQIIFL